MNNKFNKLLAQSDMSWYRHLFSKDPLFSRVNENRIDSIITDAAACGTNEALRVMQAFGTSDINEIYNALGVSIIESTDDGGCGIYYFSLYEPESVVRIYINRLQMVEETIDENVGTSSLMPATVQGLLLAHELYHVCENRNPELFTESYHLVLFKIGPFTHKSRIRILSEIGASAFAKKLCSVEYNPLILNYALLLSVSPNSAEDLYLSVTGNSKGGHEE